jgi:hypothetical protein
MPFTNLALIKKHLLGCDFGPLDITDVKVMLNGQLEVELPHHNLVSGSERVKWISQNQPLLDAGIQLNDFTWSSLSSNRLVQQSVVVATSDTLTSVYTNEVDYQVDYTNGRVRRVAGSLIPNNLPVRVYYQKFAVFDYETDYDLDTVRGLICRRENSTIPDGATVFVDYSVAAGNVSDELILQAIDETHDRLSRLLSASYSQQSNDAGLQTGETELVLSILSRDRAAEVLSRRSSSDGPARAKEWLNLSAYYEAQAWKSLRPFLDPYAQHSPERAVRA